MLDKDKLFNKILNEDRLMECPPETKTKFECKCYKPNINGDMVLVKTINTTYRQPFNEHAHRVSCKYPLDGVEFISGPFCGEIFYTTAYNALYCQGCRILAKKRKASWKKPQKSDNKEQQIKRNPKLPIFKYGKI